MEREARDVKSETRKGEEEDVKWVKKCMVKSEERTGQQEKLRGKEN